MRILVLSPFYPPHDIGGHENRCKEIVDGLANRGHVVQVLTNECNARGCVIHPTEPHVLRRLKLFVNRKNSLIHKIWEEFFDVAWIDKQVKSFQPDIVYFFGIQNLAVSILPYFSKTKFKLVFDEGGGNIIFLWNRFLNGLYFYHKGKYNPQKKIIRFIINLLISALSFGLLNPFWRWPGSMQVVFNSQSSKAFTLQQGAPVQNAVVIQSGIDLKNFNFNHHAPSDYVLNILVPGRIKPIKGTFDALRLLKILRGLGHDFTITIIGKVEDEEYFARLKNYVEENEMGENVIILDKVPRLEMSQQYKLNKFVFFPSYFKTGFSRTPLEAMACGSIIFSYGNEGSATLIDNGSTGFIVPEGAIDEVADMMVMLSNDAEMRKKITLQAREKIEKNFDLNLYVDQIQQILFKVLENKFRA